MLKVRVIEALKKAQVMLHQEVQKRKRQELESVMLESVEWLVEEQVKVAEAQALALAAAERFISGFEGAEEQEGVEELLAQIRAVI